MKKKCQNKVLTLIFLAVIAFSATACTGNPAADGSDITTIQITLSILYPESTEQENVERFPMQIEENATVMQIMESYSNQEGIPIQVSDTTPPEILAINNNAANKTSGWICLLNGKTDITEKISDYKLKNNDEIVWKYTDM